MPGPDEFAVESATVHRGLSLGAAAELGDSHRARSRTPMTVADLAVQWSVLHFDQAEIARSCCEQVAVRVAAGWPEQASDPEQLDLDGVLRELAQAQQVLAEPRIRHGAEGRGDAAAPSADVLWLAALAGRLVRAGWMSAADWSEPTVAHAVNVAVLDCRLAQRCAPLVPSLVVELDVIQLTF